MSKPLVEDLQELVSAKIISAETAAQIQHYYQNKKEEPSNKFGAVLGILGSLLAGLGIVLLVAHNWDSMPRTLQTIFGFLPLLISQGLCIYTLLRKKENVVWRESSSALLFFAVPSCIALISQIYQVSGPLSDFLFTWLWLTAPLVYVMRSSLVSLLVIAVATWYACLIGYAGFLRSGHTPIPYLYLAFILFVLPHYYYQYFKRNRDSNFFHLHNWFFALSFCITLGALTGRNYDYVQWVFIGYLALFGLFYLIGNADYFNRNRLFANPFLIIGALGTIVILLMWSFDWLWYEARKTGSGNFFYSPFSYISLLLMAAGIFFIVKRKKRSEDLYDPIGWTMYVFAAAVLLLANNQPLGLLIINLWVLAIAIWYIRKGAIQNHLGILNFGLLIIASLAILRFFDDSIPFELRGLFFLLTGIGFFVANYLLLKKRKALTQKTTV